MATTIKSWIEDINVVPRSGMGSEQTLVFLGGMSLWLVHRLHWTLPTRYRRWLEGPFLFSNLSEHAVGTTRFKDR